MTRLRFDMRIRPDKNKLKSPSGNLAPGNVPVSMTTPPSPTRPPTVQCKICGRLFGSRSIKIHEPQCQKKMQMQHRNSSVESQERTPSIKSNSLKPVAADVTTSSQDREERPSSTEKKPPMFPCYLCGRLFTVNSIYIHEPQCLKKWRIENEKLPPHKRRQEPLKPDIKFTPSGEVDFIGTFHRIWENHLAELIPCKKCGRTFFPDRIEKHENVCNGLKIKTNKKKKL